MGRVTLKEKDTFLKVVFVIDMMNCGGAESQMIGLIKGMNTHLFDITVIVLHKEGELCKELYAIEKIQMISLNMRGRVEVFQNASY